MPGPRLINALAQFFVEDSYGEEEALNARDKARAKLLQLLDGKEPGYDSTESYGRSNDSYGPATSDAPLPYIPPTEQTEDGYIGLDPPMGT